MTTGTEQSGEPAREHADQCGRCGYPLDWDGVAELIRCPECGSTHTKRWLTRERRGPQPFRAFNPKYFWFALVPSPMLAFISATGGVCCKDGIGTAIGVFWFIAAALGAASYLWFYGGYEPTCFPGQDWRRNKVLGLVLGLLAFLGASVIGMDLGYRL